MNYMRAVVKYEDRDGAVSLQQVPIPQIEPDEVLVKVSYAGICGSDPHIYHGNVSYKVNIPIILGHEFSGEVVEVGQNVSEIKVGDKVTAETHADYCGSCILCRTNNYHLCKQRKGFGFHVDGAFAEYIKVPKRIVHKLPLEVTLKEGALIEPLCVAYNALVKNHAIKPGDFVVIIGPGPIGLLCVQIAKLMGAAEIGLIGTKDDEQRLNKGKILGATFTINSFLEEPREYIITKTKDNYGVDLVVDTAGSSSTFQLAMDLVKPRGKIVKIGWGPNPLNYSLDPLISKSVTVHFSFSHTWDVWESCLTLVAHKLVDLESLITHELSLEKWKEGFDLIESKKGIKVILKP